MGRPPVIDDVDTRYAHRRTSVKRRTRSSQRPEERADVVDEQLWLLQRGKGTAARHLRPARHVGLRLHPFARREVDLLRKDGAGGGDLDASRRSATGTLILVVDAR